MLLSSRLKCRLIQSLLTVLVLGGPNGPPRQLRCTHHIWTEQSYVPILSHGRAGHTQCALL